MMRFICASMQRSLCYTQPDQRRLMLNKYAQVQVGFTIIINILPILVLMTNALGNSSFHLWSRVIALADKTDRDRKLWTRWDCA